MMRHSQAARQTGKPVNPRFTRPDPGRSNSMDRYRSAALTCWPLVPRWPHASRHSEAPKRADRCADAVTKWRASCGALCVPWR